MNDVEAGLLKHLLRIARTQGRYTSARDLGHGSEYIEQLQEALTEAVDFLKENSDLPAGTPLLSSLAVEMTYASGAVMVFLGAESHAEEDVIRALDSLREAGKVEEAGQMETYQGISAYALSRLSSRFSTAL